MEKELILISDYCQNSCLELDFILLLEEEGLIETEIREDKRYIQSSQLSDLEMFKRLHYDLAVNIEGIDVINNLLRKMRIMEHELKVLRRQIDSHPIFHSDIFEDFE